MRTTTTAVRAALERTGDAPVTPPKADFVDTLEDRLLQLAGAPHLLASVNGAPIRRSRRMAVGAGMALAAAVAVVLGVLMPRPATTPRQVTTAEPDSFVPTTAAPAAPAPITDHPTPPVTEAVRQSPTAPPTTAGRPPGSAPPAAATETTGRPEVTPAPVERRPKPTPTTTTTSNAPDPTTTTVGPVVGTTTMSCASGFSAGKPATMCEWSKSDAADFGGYKLYRQLDGTSRVVAFSTTDQTIVRHYDFDVAAGKNYHYQVEVLNTKGQVISRSAAIPVACC